jgi:hypothetical protein
VSLCVFRAPLNGATNFFYFYQEDEIDFTTVTIKMFEFLENISPILEYYQAKVGKMVGGPLKLCLFLLGNMITTTTKIIFLLGYFHIAETDNFFNVISN